MSPSSRHSPTKSSSYGFSHHNDDSSSSSIVSFYDDSSSSLTTHSQSTSSSSSSSCHSQSSSLSVLSRKQLQLLQLRTPKWRARVVYFVVPLFMTIMMQLLYLRDAAPSSLAKVYHITTTTTTTATSRRTQADDWSGQSKYQYRVSFDQPSIMTSTATSATASAGASSATKTIAEQVDSDPISKATELATNATTSSTTTTPLPPPKFPPPKSNFTVAQSAGACLLIKDDNHWLIEWLAFHYHVLPLRHLIVVIDPHSLTSPRAILDRYQDLMQIHIWNEKDFLPPIPRSMKQQYLNNTHLLEHRHRQGSFYEACLKHFQKQRVPWVQLTDTDEFTLLHHHAVNQKHPSDVQAYAIEQPGSVVRYLNARQTSRKCLYMQRYLVGAAESNATLVQRYVPQQQQQQDDTSQTTTTPPTAINASQFLTQRFLTRSKTFTPYGKNMMHLTATDKIMALRNPHRVSTHCPSSRQGKNDESSFWVQVRHYIGTPDQFFFRSDPRTAASTLQPGKGNYPARDFEHYRHLHQQGSHTVDTNGQGWIQGFIDDVGLERAAFLLQGVGQVGVE